jgi:hypothetical protein
MNTVEIGRTNAFRVRSASEFLEWARLLNGADVHETGPKNDPRFCMTFPENGIPDRRGMTHAEAFEALKGGDRTPTDEDVSSHADQNEVKINFIEEMSKHLMDREVCVVVYVSYTGLRSMCGVAFAFDNKGRRVYVGTDDIYKKAEECFGHQVPIAEGR